MTGVSHRSAHRFANSLAVVVAAGATGLTVDGNFYILSLQILSPTHERGAGKPAPAIVFIGPVIARHEHRVPFR